MARRIRGFDFTVAPGRRKPITCAECRLEGEVLVFDRLVRLTEADLSGFEAALRESGPWVAGLDVPFGLPRAFLDAVGWADGWASYVARAGALPAEEFDRLLTEWTSARPVGLREPFRRCEAGTGAASPLTLSGPPVGRMFHRAACRLLRSGAAIPGLHPGDPDRVCVEAYPGMAARRMLRAAGHRRFTYRADRAGVLPQDVRDLMHARRLDILRELGGAAGREVYGLRVIAPASLADDAAGDEIDALLAAVQAAWAVRRLAAPGALAAIDPWEGWIADPASLAAPLARAPC